MAVRLSPADIKLSSMDQVGRGVGGATATAVLLVR